MKIILKSPQIINEISELLIGAELVPTELEKNNLYWFGEKNDKDELIAVIGVERYSDICLFRSLAVKAEERNKGIGDKLIKEAVSFAISININEAYLITSAIAEKMKRYGFVTIDRSSLPHVIKESPFIREICPATSCIMYKTLSGSI